MLTQLQISWHRFWYLNYNYILDTSVPDSLFVPLLKKSTYHQKKLIFLFRKRKGEE
ncbi:hypothetical protein ACUXCC_004534 [Cytobacillus horneckiae]